MLAARGTILITNNNTGTYVTGGLPPAPTHAKSKLDEELAATTDHKDRARAILEEMNQFLNITTDLANGGTYRASAERDRTVASWLRIVAFCLYGAAAVVAGCLFIWSNNNPPESWEWLPKFLIGGPVLRSTDTRPNRLAGRDKSRLLRNRLQQM